MTTKEIVYKYEKKVFKRALLTHLKPITISTFSQCFIAMVCGFIYLNAYMNNDIVLFNITAIPAMICLLGAGIGLVIYIIFFKNLLITAYNWSYDHYLTIDNNQVVLLLKSSDGLKEEKYKFPIKKIKLEKDNYLIFKNNNHFVYVPKELFDASKQD
ncbi:MAG: hypothetical protein SO253_03560 [Bacilli bacterium]|nr:hypothetical protein [Bacilli bacterium]